MSASGRLKVKGVRTAHGRVQLWQLDDGWVEVPDLEFASRRWAPMAVVGLVVFLVMVFEVKRGFAWARPTAVAGLSLFGLGLLLTWISNRRMKWRTGRDINAEVGRQITTATTSGGRTATLGLGTFYASGQRLRATWPYLSRARTVAAVVKAAKRYGYSNQVWAVARDDLAEVVTRSRWLYASAYFRLTDGTEYRYSIIGIKAPERLRDLLVSFRPGACTGVAGTAASTAPRRTRPGSS